MIEIDADTRIRGYLKTLIEHVESSERTSDYTQYTKMGDTGMLAIFCPVDGVDNRITIYMDNGPDDRPEPIDWAVNMTRVIIQTPSSVSTHDLANDSDADACLARLRAMMSWGWL